MNDATQPTTRHIITVTTEQADVWQRAVTRGETERITLFQRQIQYIDQVRVRSYYATSATRPDVLYEVLVSNGGDEPVTASCDCPAAGICKHMAMVLLDARLFPFTIFSQEVLDLAPEPTGGRPVAIGPVLFPPGQRVVIASGPDAGVVGVVTRIVRTTLRRVDSTERRTLGMHTIEELRLAPAGVQQPVSDAGLRLLLPAVGR